MKCTKHPDIETSLTCGRCGTPICPKCLVQTPVGSRCRKCAGLKQLPTYTITPWQYLKAIGTGLVLAIVMGIAWTFLWEVIPFFGLFLAAGVGYIIGEGISLSVNRKRGRFLQVIGALCFCLALSNTMVEYSPLRISFNLWDLPALAIGIYIVISRLR